MATGVGLGDYALNHLSSDSSIYERLHSIWIVVKNVFLNGSMAVMRTPVSKAIHYILGGLTAFLLVFWQIKKKKWVSLIWFSALFLMLVLAIFGVMLLGNGASNMTVFAFFSFYVLAIIVLEKCDFQWKRYCEKIFAFGMVCVLISNIYLAQRIYFTEYLAYEEAYSFCTAVVSRIGETEGYDENAKVAVIGYGWSADRWYSGEATGTEDTDVIGLIRNLTATYSRQKLFMYFCGYEPEWASEEDVEKIQQTEEFQAMPCYPYYGSTAKIGDTIVVKLS